MKLKWVGFGFILHGLIEFLIAKRSCDSVCPSCNFEQLKPCLFILVFVGIVFMVVGLIILTFKGKPNLPKIKIKKKKKLSS